MSELKKVFLNDHHQNLGANLTPFGGFNMPLYYSTIADEHHAIRNDVGVFDVSHMGEIHITGKDTLMFLNYVLSNNIQPSSKTTYTFILNELGNIIDDLLVYTPNELESLLVVNASNIDKDLKHLIEHSTNFDVLIRDRSNEFGCLAIQGPNSSNVLSKLFDKIPKHTNEFFYNLDNDNPTLISRTGYTGEDGFEIYGNAIFITKVWEELMELEVLPVGLGARDTLRFEAGMPLYGNELSESINPVEAGLTFAVDFKKDDFIGKDVLFKYKDKPLRKLIALELIDKNIARAGYLVYKDGEESGYITTGYLTPTTKKALAFALVKIKHAKIGTIMTIKIRNKDVKAVVRNKSFIKKNNNI